MNIGDTIFYQVKELPKGYANKLWKQSGADTQAPSAITGVKRQKWRSLLIRVESPYFNLIKECFQGWTGKGGRTLTAPTEARFQLYLMKT